MPRVSELISSAEGGNRRDIGKLITIIENRSNGYSNLLKRIKTKKTNSYVVGITGPPGVGKSSLISRLAAEFSKKEKLAIIMIDATSPYSGGSLLGNRLRLNGTDNIYVRSMATRGSTGGLNLALGDSLDLLSYLGFSMILVESVGTGQDETDILHYSDKIVMVLSPGMGDQVQAIKAGQMEIGDFVVLNKADKPEAIIAEKELMETISIPDQSKSHSLVKVSALTGEGIKGLADMISSSRNVSNKEDSALNREKERIRREILAKLKSNEDLIEKYAKEILAEKITREKAVIKILKEAVK
ncbi:MAG: GTP-binding protein [Thermoplasmatales archaeon]